MEVASHGDVDGKEMRAALPTMAATTSSLVEVLLLVAVEDGVAAREARIGREVEVRARSGPEWAAMEDVRGALCRRASWSMRRR
jgi:hypothetical protein